VDRLVAHGPLARHYLEGAGALPAGSEWTQDEGEAIRLAREAAQPGAAVLVKGSRAMQLERVVERLLGD